VEAELALGKYRDIPEVCLEVGLVLLICGNPAVAMEQFDVAVAIRSQWAEADAQRGAALAELRRLKDAVAALEAALSFDPEHEGARANLETIRSATG
jgi:Flp pilus assembly protein TadD